MTQLTLSSDLIEITAEINSYKQVAGQAVFEIGKRLKHVRDNDLAHGQWIAWLESVSISHSTAKRMIQAFEQFPNSATSHHLDTSKIFEMLSLPESIDRQEFIEKPHTIPSTGETKKVDDMTVKELREVKKALQQAEERAAKAEQEKHQAANNAEHYQKLWNQEKNKPPRIQTQTVQVVPDDYEQAKKQAAQANEMNIQIVQLKRALQEQRESYELKLTQEDKRKAVNKDLKKFCQEMLQQHGMYSEAIVYNAGLNMGDRDAFHMIESFLIQYTAETNELISKLKQMTTVRAVN
jgi:hypothetical protein